MVKIEFGKYKNHTLAELFEKDFLYFKWLSELDDCDIPQEEFKKFEYDQEDWMLPFGKFKWRRVSDIYANEKKYFDWLTTQEFKSTDLTKAINYYKNLDTIVE
jgi:uncharacterized protein (DUF3820 family)